MRISDWSADVCSSDLILRLLVVVIDHGGDLVVGDPEHCREETEEQIFGGDLVEKISEQRSVVARDRPQGQAQPRSGDRQAHVWTAVTNAPLVCRILLVNKTQYTPIRITSITSSTTIRKTKN